MSLPYATPTAIPLGSFAARASPSASFATLSLEETVSQQNTNLETGLNHQEVAYRQRIHGPNELTVEDGETIWSKFVDQFKNPLILLLLGSAGLSVLLGEIDDAVSISLAIIIVITVAFVQEYRSEKSLEALNKLVPYDCHVIRNGQISTVLASELVPGDVVKFATGDRIPADIRLAITNDLQIDESSLTGENEPCKKHHDPIEGRSMDLPLAERKNVAFMGTLVRHGHGSGVVIGTGKNTEFGVVFNMMKEVEVRKTPLQLKMDQLGKQLSLLSFVIIGLITIIGILQGRPWLEMFTIGVSLAVAAIPEGLPIVVTVTLALGVLRMAGRHAIVKKLPSVEALGSVNVICADKTGTLTTNKMTITKMFTMAESSVVDVHSHAATSLLNSPAVKLLLRIGNLCNNAHVDDTGQIVGQPTEVAFLELLRNAGMTDERKPQNKVSEIPFNAENKWMAVEYRDAANRSPSLFYVKGAMEPVLQRCKRYLAESTDEKRLDSSIRARAEAVAEEITMQGLRLIFLAYGTSLTELTLVGFIGMSDPPRPGVPEAIRTLVRGGVRLVMITGDSVGTASSIAHQLGIPMNPTQGVMSGPELDSFSDRELAENIPRVSVFYRATPRHKMVIVRTLQARGDIVAMTGDGVNDAPALRLSDIGISMGKSGTDVAKEAADMILVNDDFSTVLYAIEEGKSIFYNIQNFLRFQLSTSIAALTLIAVATFLRLPNPLNAMQILWINIICDGPVAQSLGVEAVDPDVMRRPPRHKNEPIITQPFIIRVLASSAVVVLGTIIVYAQEMGNAAVDGTIDTRRGTTMTFTVFVLFSLFNALTCRSQTRSILSSIGPFTNKMFNYAAAACIFFQLAVVYWSVLQRIFQTTGLSLADWLWILFVSSAIIAMDEVWKKWNTRNWLVWLGGERRGWMRVYTDESMTKDEESV